MPKGTKVWHCVQSIMDDNPDMDKGQAIAICQDRTGQSYQTGEKTKEE